MALYITLGKTTFGVGDTVKVIQKIKEGGKQRQQSFTGIVMKIKGRGENKTFTVRRVGVQKVGIERIFPVVTPTLVGIEVVRKGTKGVKHSKIYFIRNKSKKEIEKIYSRVSKKGKVQEHKSKVISKKTKKKPSRKKGTKK